MRYRLSFSIKNSDAILPFYHQEEIRNCISFLLEKNGYDLENSKSLTFSSLKGGFRTIPGGLELTHSKVTFIISGTDRALIEKIKEAVFLEKEISIGSLILEPLFATIEEKPLNFENKMKYLCLSPICISMKERGNQEESFIHPTNPLFSDLLYYSTMDRMEMTGNYSTQELETFSKFQFIGEEHYLEKLKGMEQKYSRNYRVYYNRRQIVVRGFILPFTLYAHPKVQEFVYFNGLGLLNEQGWGALDFLKEQLPKAEEILLPHKGIKKRESLI